MPGAEERRGGAASSRQPRSDLARSRRRVKSRLRTVSFVDGRSGVPDLWGFASHSCPVGLPSPPVANQLSEALARPYTELMRLRGYRVPGDSNGNPTNAVSAALFADLTEDERDELLEYLAWYRARRRARTGAPAPGDGRLREPRRALGQDELAPRSVKQAGPDGHAASRGARP